MKVIEIIFGVLWYGILQSSVCHLRGLDQRQMVAAKEEATEMGGLVALHDRASIVL